jgi:hypothetical protein
VLGFRLQSPAPLPLQYTPFQVKVTRIPLVFPNFALSLLTDFSPQTRKDQVSDGPDPLLHGNAKGRCNEKVDHLDGVSSCLRKKKIDKNKIENV